MASPSRARRSNPLPAISESGATLTLSCWLRGSNVDSIFTIEILSTNTVNSLKKAIRDENPEFRDIDFKQLGLYLTEVSDDDNVLRRDLNNWRSDERSRMGGRRRLSYFGLSDNSLIVVVAPGLAQPSAIPEVTFNCWARGNDANRIFQVEISSTKTVADLKSAIQKVKPVEFSGVDPDSLALYRVSVPLNDCRNEILQGLSVDQKEPLMPLLDLADISANMNKKSLHIVVEAPPSTRLPVCSEMSAKSSTLHGVASQRATWLDKNQPVAPSDGGDTREFSSRQAKSDNEIYCGRPSTAIPSIPVTLLHPVLCQFCEDCETLGRTPGDNAFALELSKKMSAFYDSELLRVKTIRRVFTDHGLPFTPSITPNEYKTDGDLSVDGVRYALLEVENEVGWKGAEPFAQACLYYMELARDSARTMEGECIPFMIILIFGPYIGFAGAAWNIRPEVQMFSILHTHYHPTDTYMRVKLARHLGALKKAILALKNIYQNTITLRMSLSPPRPQLFPYPTHFTSLSGTAQTRIDFQYKFQPFQDRLVFYGTIPTENREICIKFVRRYSKKVHELCASWGCAPELLGFEIMPAGWFMVVMDKLDPKEYSTIRALQGGVRSLTDQQMQKIRETLSNLHLEGWVHGDVRDANIMISRTEPDRFMFLDFDWAGKIGEVRYPMNVNKGEGLWRPERVIDEELILAEDDEAMWKHVEDNGRAMET